MLVNVICPYCCMSNTINELLVGKSVQCKHCNAEFIAENPAKASEASMAQNTDLSQPWMKPQKKPRVWLYTSIVVGVGILALVYAFVIHPLIFHGLPGWTKHYLSENTVMVLYVDMENFSDSKLFKDYAKEYGPESFEDTPIIGDTVNLAMIEDMLFVIDQPSTGEIDSKDIHLAIRLNKDISLSDFAGETVARKDSCDGVEYIQVTTDGETREKLSPKFIAKTGERTFCMAESEEHLRKIISQVKGEKGTPLPPDLKQALDEVSDQDSFMAVMNLENTDLMPQDCSSVGFGFTIGSSVTLEAAVVFENTSKAKEVYKMLKAALEMAQTLPYDKDEAGRLGSKIADSVDISRSGRAVSGEIKISNEDLNTMALLGEKEKRKFSDEIDGHSLDDFFDILRHGFDEEKECPRDFEDIYDNDDEDENNSDEF